MRALLHVDLVEYGESGRVWDRASITVATSVSGEPITAAGMQARRLGPDTVLLTYRSESSGRRAELDVDPRPALGVAAAVPPRDVLRLITRLSRPGLLRLHRWAPWSVAGSTG
ncbi:hypothetical protein [Blastococcus colisei]|uniref:hypothetical protein n=1 Tax=Blastococcus colisei TaxID=1564162 RepID=UPI003CCC6EAE